MTTTATVELYGFPLSKALQRAFDEQLRAVRIAPDRWLCTSQNADHGFYEVFETPGVVGYRCTCPAGQNDRMCKHAAMTAFTHHLEKLGRKGDTAFLKLYGARVAQADMRSSLDDVRRAYLELV